MLKIKNLIKPKTIEEAYELYSTKKSSKLIGGGAFLRLGKKELQNGIDLYGLNLNYINDFDTHVEIGSMTTLRDIETSLVLKNNFSGILPMSVENIVGVQFRNIATIGATVASKYGFSDPLTALLCLDTYLVFHNMGEIALNDYINLDKIPRDILVKIIIKKTTQVASFQMMRHSPSDYAMLNCSLGFDGTNYKLCIGARPQRAKIGDKTSKSLSNGDNIDVALSFILDDFHFGTNIRASGEYREHLATVLSKRAYLEVNKNANNC